MSNSEEIRATITELMARDTSVEDSGAAFFKASIKAKVNSQTNSDRKEAVRIKDRLKKMNMLVPGSVLDAEYGDEYSRIKRPLLSNAFGKTAHITENGNLILVTSSLPGEGKTHTAINLALSIARECDRTMLLVDCDLTRQGSSRVLGIKGKPGLVDILEDESLSVGDTILKTDIPGFCIIPAGKPYEYYATELLASQRMLDVVVEISTRYDDRVIVFDAPPLLSTPQTQILATLVGQVVFVIEAGKTPQSIVSDALKLIPEEQATGLVMNKSEGMSRRGSHYYGYGDKE